MSVLEVTGNAAKAIGGIFSFGNIFTKETIQLEGENAETK